MNSQSVAAPAWQRPRLQHLPQGKVTSSGYDAVEFAADAGLFLDEWQAWVLEEALADRADGLWAAFEVCLICPRQNGKNAILEALELYHLYVLGSRLVTHSAHEFRTAREHFLRIQHLVRESDVLTEQTEHIYESNGHESIVLRSGARLNFVARSKGSGRGFSGDLIVLDEAYSLPERAIGAMGPTLSAMPNPQVWYTSSAPHADSFVLHGVRNRGIAGDSDRLFFAEWGNDAGVDPNDHDALVAANPGYPHRLTPENIAAERDMMRGLGDEWPRERLGVPSAEDRTAGVFPVGIWPACLDSKSEIVGEKRLALDVSPNMTFASFAIAGLNEQGLTHGELATRHPGTDWVVDEARTATTTLGIPLWIDPRGPAGALLADLEDAQVPVEQIRDGDFARACTSLQEKVLAGTFRHIGQRPLDDAVAGAAIRPSSDTWRWSRTSSNVDISPLVAVTIAAAVAVPAKVELLIL